MILDPESVDRDVRLSADVCVIGSGAGGAVVAHELAAAGKSVVVLEEGRYWRTKDFDQLEEHMYSRLYRERGTKPTSDYAVLVSQGRALGGTTVVSFCLCFRTPRRILEHWRERFGLADLSYEALVPHFERTEETIGVKDMGPADLNANNRVLVRGAERLGYRGRFARHNRTDCVGAGYCALGCSYGRKGDMLSTYLPAASRRGARILPEVRVENVLHDGVNVRGVRGRLRRSKSGDRLDVRVDAPIVVLAAGALESPMLWLRSELPNRHGVVGRNLHLHPYVIVAGLFEEPIRSWEGIPQSYVVEEFQNLGRSVDGGFLAFSAAAPPVTTASILPGFGAAHRTLMADYARTAGIALFLHDRTSGEVRADARGRAVIRYELVEEDKKDVMRAMTAGTDLLFAAGARSVVLPYNEVVELRRSEQAKVIEERGIHSNDPLFVSFHPHGTLRMGNDPKTSVVDSTGAAHGFTGLFVADASVLPGSVAVPPQLTIMALASRTAHRILDTGAIGT